MSQNKDNQEGIAELRDLLSDSKEASRLDDFELAKWLTACVGDVKKAESMYRKSEAYKEKMRVVDLLEKYNPPEVLKLYFPGGVMPEDKEGRMLKVELFGKYDMAGLMRSCTLQQLERHKLHECEMIKRHSQQQSKKLGRRVDGVTVIFDMEGTGSNALWKPGLDMFLYLVKVLEDNYPEMMRRLMVVNAPSILPVLWNLGKPLISQDMCQKIFFYGDDYRERLLEHVSEEHLPAFLGGKLTDEDGNPRCVSKIGQGGTVPEEYTIHTEYHPFATAIIAPASTYLIDAPVAKTFSTLHWQFKTEDKDIGVELLHVLPKEGTVLTEEKKREGWSGRVVSGVWRKVGRKESEKTVLEYQRLTANQIIMEDCHHCWAPGIYRLVFDNSYSWTRQKKLFYRVWLSGDGDDSES